MEPWGGGGQEQKLESERKHHKVDYAGGFEKDKGIKLRNPFGV